MLSKKKSSNDAMTHHDTNIDIDKFRRRVMRIAN